MLSHSFGLLVLGLEVFAQVAEASYSLGNSTGNASTSISETCLTKYGHASLKTVLSSTHTDTIASTVYSTVQSTPTVTFTPAPSTFTSTSTVFSTLTTTQSTATDTFTSIDISTETATSVTTQVVTAYTTTVITQTVQSSTSVAAPAGFTPLGSVYSVATKRKRSNRDRFEEEPKHEEESNDDCTCVEEEETPEPSTSAKPTTSHKMTEAPKPTTTTAATTSPIKLTCNESGKPVLNTQLYPTAVNCEKTLLIVGTAIVTRVSNSTQTQTGIASSVYTTVTAVESVTVTVAPADASTTITIQSTQTSTATITATSTTLLTVTSVTTSVLPTSTTYAQCQANNIISYINSNPVVEVDLTNGLLATNSAASSTNCCIQCATATGCGGFAYLSGSCFLLKDGSQGTVCNGAVHSWSFQTSTSTSGSPITVGNGACGQGLWGGAPV